MDLFDSINNLTTNNYNEGFIEGQKCGSKAAIAEGFRTGVRISMSINTELGYYTSICELFINEAKKKEGSQLRAINLANQICELISKVDILNPHDALDHIRDKFKQFCSLTNFKSDFKKSVTDPSTLSMRAQAMRLNF